MNNLHITTLINHGTAGVRLHQLRAGCPHVDITIGPGLRKRVLTDAPGARTLAGLASMQHGLSVLPTDTGEPWPVTADANTIR